MPLIAVITGASSGLGKEYVSQVLKQYPALDEVWVLARRRERLDELKARLGNKVRPVPADITDRDAVNGYVELLKSEKAEVRLLINNAGYGKLGNFDAVSADDNAGIVRLNCEALTVMTSVTLPFIPDGSEIINTCSIAAFAPNTRMAVYCSTKAYVMSLSRCLRSELKPRRINVLAVCPGPMDTEFLALANIPKGASRTFDTLPRVNPEVMAKKSLAASKKHRAVYTNKLFFKFYRFLAKVLPCSWVMKMSAA